MQSCYDRSYPSRLFIYDLEPVKIPMFYYHVTDKDFGHHVVLHPRGNNDDNVLRGPDEPEIARICVAPTISGCLTSVLHLRLTKFKVYRTWRKEIAYWPVSVFDSDATREKWLVDPTDFILRAELEIEDLYDNVGTWGVEERYFQNRRAIKDCLLEHGLKDKP